ncbi:hypothetical protein GCM10010387_12860 [Streptomyces inusitatus]|uniref:Monooxygenase n=1 Tax=Streptomyces inusitatus TaxID=68221 RepID=A0A918PSD5_9ACTN|nr:DUF5990 family protein [Streptomyces inusitatus]GGZ21261.1 hypothetical protein GCM10010387_12860 [Streptomyces inusitatus]
MVALTLRITGRELPGSVCGEWTDVHIGTQRGREPDQLVRADAAEAVFEIPLSTVTAADGGVDFRGPHVQGRRGARFVYLTWGELPPGGEFAVFRRAKLFLADLPEAAIASGGTAETAVALTDSQGLPLCAALRPPLISWSTS